MEEIHIKGQDWNTPEPISLNLEFTSETHLINKDPHSGDLCLHCHNGHLDYDGLLNLVCQQCGYTFAGCST
jgi:hypothetical protein